jgi:small subunit ribosomal protein S3
LSAVKNVIKDNYNMMLLKDYLREAIKDSGFSHAEISKTPTGTRVVLHVTRPGIVIGRKGAGIRDLTEKLEKDFGLKSPQIAVNEIAQPELTSSVMCNRLASLIQRGTAFRRATMWTLQQVMGAGAMGVQITVSGKLRGDRSSFEKHSVGILPRAGHYARVVVDEDTTHVPTPMGYIGIRIRIARKERHIPEFELKGVKEETAENKRIRLEKEEEERKAQTESEQVKLDAEKIAKMDLMEEVEEKLK